MTLTTERQQFAEQNEMSMDFVNWFFDEKKDGCGNAWFIMAAAMWEGWKGQAANREAQPVYQYRMRNPYNGQVTDWETIKPEQVDFILKETIAANVEFRIIAAPPAPAVQDEIDSFADQVIGTKDKIIRLPAPMPVPLEGIRVYLNADTIISYLEKQGHIVEVSRE